MAGLASSLATPHTTQFDEFDEDAQDEIDLRRNAIDEIERYRRIDEWISSYHNVYTVVALGCLLALSKVNVKPPRLTDFLQYTRAGNAENVRLEAFSCLIELDGLKVNGILDYILHTLSTDTSPYVREELSRLLGVGLGRLAIGGERLAQPANGGSFGGLIVEQEGSTESRQADFARRRTVEGALAALKTEFAERDAFKKALWSAVR